MTREPSDQTVRLLRLAVASPEVVARFRAKVRTVPGHECSWWVRAISGAGHGRFSLGRDGSQTVTIVAHRFAFALEHGVDELLAARVLAHKCDNTLCQRIDPEHVVVSTPRLNRLEWATRRNLAGNPLGDRRGGLRRAREIRAQILTNPDPALVDQAVRIGLPDGDQAPLW